MLIWNFLNEGNSQSLVLTHANKQKLSKRTSEIPTQVQNFCTDLSVIHPNNRMENRIYLESFLALQMNPVCMQGLNSESSSPFTYSRDSTQCTQRRQNILWEEPAWRTVPIVPLGSRTAQDANFQIEFCRNWVFLTWLAVLRRLYKLAAFSII